MKTRTLTVAFLTAGFLAFPASAQAPKKAAPKAAPKAKRPKAASLDELLKRVKKGWKEDSAETKQREAHFQANKAKQAKLLKKARARLAAMQKRSENMERKFDENEALMARLEETLRIRLGTMGELFGVIRQMAGTAMGHLDTSLISAQFPGRGKILMPLATSKGLPSVKQIEELWYLLQQEMIESGKVVRFKTKIFTTAGKEVEKEIIRIGTFTTISDKQFVVWEGEVGKLQELSRQPGSMHMAGAAALSDAKEGFVRMSVDPTRGQLLSVLVQTPSFIERLDHGGIIGYIIMGLGALTFLLALMRGLVLSIVGLKVRRQIGSKTPSSKNPLGRIMEIHTKNPDLDLETLEHRLDEAILRESAKLERFLWAVKIVSVVAPLMGLLGTVTGMIRTFTSIVMYGTGDPKVMAGGISEALMTTMLGLIVAIPLVLLHAWLNSISKRVSTVLEEQSTGIIATQAEKESCADGASS